MSFEYEQSFKTEKPEPRIIPPSEQAVREALRNVMHGSNITEEQFESLLCGVIEAEVYGKRFTSDVINDFCNEHGIIGTK